jgi:hypothetical protein
VCGVFQNVDGSHCNIFNTLNLHNHFTTFIPFAMAGIWHSSWPDVCSSSSPTSKTQDSTSTTYFFLQSCILYLMDNVGSWVCINTDKTIRRRAPWQDWFHSEVWSNHSFIHSFHILEWKHYSRSMVDTKMGLLPSKAHTLEWLNCSDALCDRLSLTILVNLPSVINKQIIQLREMLTKLDTI